MMNSCPMMKRTIGRKAGNPDGQLGYVSEPVDLETDDFLWPEGRPSFLEGGVV